MSTQSLDCWIDVMHKYTDSYLWVKETNKFATNNLLDYFKSKSIDLSRIVFAKRENLYKDHLARYKKGDLLLDTFLYNGHTTTIEALWSGLPVITLEGNSFASRVSASILKSIGLDKLISSSKVSSSFLTSLDTLLSSIFVAILLHFLLFNNKSGSNSNSHLGQIIGFLLKS